jgi:hypothetical protein
MPSQKQKLYGRYRRALAQTVPVGFPRTYDGYAAVCQMFIVVSVNTPLKLKP